MENIRFEKFALLIDGVQKSIQKFKMTIAPIHGVKGVHVLWLYKLFVNPEGLTSAELAVKSNIDPSLISRELASLKRKGYITHEATPSKRNYNSRITLTDEGRLLGGKIQELALDVQERVGRGVSIDELAVFYSVLERLHDNLEKFIEETEIQE